MVSASRPVISSAVHGASGGPAISPCPSANTAVCPAVSRIVAVALESATAKLTDVDSSSRLAPPRAISPHGTGNKIGWTSPYSGRGE